MSTNVELEVTPEAKVLLDKADARCLAKGIAVMEGVVTVTPRVIECLGAGTPECEQLKHCTGSAETAVVIHRLATLICRGDKSLSKAEPHATFVERRAAAIPKVVRLLSVLLDLIKKPGEAGGVGSGLLVTTGTEE